jgi:hypothetical protein
MHRRLPIVASVSWLALSACASAPSAGHGPGPAPAPPVAPQILVRTAPIPPPTTLAALIEVYRTYEPALEIARCQLPDVIRATDWVTLRGPDDGLQLQLPPGWRARPPGDSSFGQPETVLEDPVGSRVRASRVITASGRPNLAKLLANQHVVELPHSPPCQLGPGPAGSVWTLYLPDPDATSGILARYVAYGDLITAAGRRYRVSVGASSADARDRLVRIVSAAAYQLPRERL